MSTHLSLIFPTKDEALLVARYISGNPEVEEFPPDGWVTDPETGAQFYYNICALGTQMYDTGKTNPDGSAKLAPIMWVVEYDQGPPDTWEAYCMIGLWHGSEETIPFPLQAFMVQDLGVRYG
jgi:hypothetical protein